MIMMEKICMLGLIVLGSFQEMFVSCMLGNWSRFLDFLEEMELSCFYLERDR